MNTDLNAPNVKELLKAIYQQVLVANQIAKCFTTSNVLQGIMNVVYTGICGVRGEKSNLSNRPIH